MLIVTFFSSIWYIISTCGFSSSSFREMFLSDNSVFLFQCFFSLPTVFREHQLFFFGVLYLSFRLKLFFLFASTSPLPFPYVFIILSFFIILLICFFSFHFLPLLFLINLFIRFSVAHNIFQSVCLALEFPFIFSTLSSYWMFLLSSLILQALMGNLYLFLGSYLLPAELFIYPLRDDPLLLSLFHPRLLCLLEKHACSSYPAY